MAGEGMSTRRNKYGARKVVVDGLKFDSQHEAKRWQELRLLQREGRIYALERQVKFVLAPKVKIEGEKRARSALKFTADFRYIETRTSRSIVEDAKGFPDTAFRIRQHLMKAVHNIDVRLS